MKHNYLVLMATTLFISGCGATVSCDDETVKQLVTELADEEIGMELGFQLGVNLAERKIELEPSKIGWNLDAIRTIDTNKKNNIIQCAAKVQMMYDGQPYLEHDVDYTTQPTDDGKQVYVEAEF
jgi:hypothetical protein